MKFEKNKFNNNDKNKSETLPEKEKRLAREIEKLPADVLERANLMLVWRGLKPSTEFTYILKTWGAGDPEPVPNDKRNAIHIQEFTQLLGFMGLSAVAEKLQRQEPSFEVLPDKKEIEIPGKESQTFYIAHELKIAEELFEQTENSMEKPEISKEHMVKIQELRPILYAEILRNKNTK